MNQDSIDKKYMKIALTANIAMFFIGLAGWHFAKSASLLADAFDMLADASGYTFALFAIGRSPQFKAKSITVSQIPQSKFRDVAGIVLGIEPEYLFDVPSMRWLWQWYLISLFGVLAGCYVFVVVCYGLVHLTNRKPSVRESKTHDVVSVSTAWAFWILAFIAGALGTTLLSRWTQEFVFTWPVCLFVAWHAAISNLSTRSANRTRQSRLKSASAAIFLLIVCLVYFLLCRRLSLVFEWVFLCGFPAAVPFGLAGKYLIATGRWAHAWRLLMTALAFSAFYWSSVAFLHLRSG